jgi:protein-S-isoprenylcysteine O-methyltransferase Ste14
MQEAPRWRSYLLLLGDFTFFLALFVLAVMWRRDQVCIWGSVLAVPSFVLWLVAKLELGSSFTARAEARALVTRGLYSRIRHPIYFFSTLAIVGIAICLRSRWFDLYVVVQAILQLCRIRLEERALRNKFGETYLEYRRQTWF